VATGAGWIQDRSLTEDADARAVAAELDPVAAIGQAPDRQVRPRLIQFGTRDDVIGAARLRRFAGAATEPKRVMPYDAGHMLNVRAVKDRLAWLSRELGLRAMTARISRLRPYRLPRLSGVTGAATREER